MHRHNLMLLFVSHGDDISHVVLAFGIVVGQLRQPTLKVLAISHQNTGVHFTDSQLFSAGIFVLDNARHLAVFTQDTAITGRVIQLRRQQTNAIHRLGLQQTLQCIGGNQRHIPVQHQHHFIVSKMRRGLLHRMTGTQLFRLDHPIQIITTQTRLQLIAAVAVDQMDIFGTDTTSRINHVRHHRFTGNRMQHFWQIGMHPGAFTGCQNNHAEMLIWHAKNLN